MKTTRLIGLALAAVCAAAGVARAEFPEKPVTLLIGYAPGGGTDTVGRVLATRMAEDLGQPVNVVNMPGAAGGVAAMTLTRKPADGYTLFLAPGATLAVYPLQNEALTYKPEDFTLIASIADFQPAFVGPASAPYDTLDEFLAWAKENGPAKYGTLTPTSRMLMEAIRREADVEINFVPLRSGGDMVNAIMGGQVDVAYSGGMHQRHADSVKVLASASNRPLERDPDKPTLRDLGYDVDSGSSFVVAAPAGLPAEVSQRLEAAVSAAFESADMQKLLKNTGFPARFVGAEAASQELLEARDTGVRLIEIVGPAE